MYRRPYYRDTDENLAYYLGDHWQTWVGPIVPPEADPDGQKMAAIRRVFQSANILAECCDNWRDGLISQDFTWYLKGANGERTEAPEAELQLQRWLDWVNEQALHLDPCATNFQQADPWSEFVLSLGVLGEGNLRLWQPDRFADDPDPIHKIHLHSPKAGSVEVDRGDDGFIDKITYNYGENQREVQVFNESGDLEITVPGSEEPLTLPTGRRWTIQQVKSRSILSPSVKQLQNSINHSLTMKLRNGELSGFRERVFLNCQPPGEWVSDASAPSGQRFVPGVPLDRGPGIDSYHYGVPEGDSNNPGYATPSLFESEPVSPATFRESIQEDIGLIYRQFKQGHLLASGDGANLSGESRIQQRQAFELFLKGWKRRVEAAIAATLNIVLKILEYEGLEVVVELRITTGKLSAEETGAIITQYDKGLLSQSTAMALIGSVDDVDAELAMIEEERATATAVQPVNRLTSTDLFGTPAQPAQPEPTPADG